MRVGQFWLSCAFFLAVVGCDTVTSVSPVGDEPLYLEPEDWEGIWVHQVGEGVSNLVPEMVMVRVLDAAGGILEYGDPNDCSKRSQVLLRQHRYEGEPVAQFVNQLDDWGYRWGKVQRVGNALVIWPPVQEAFQNLVNKGEISGQLFKSGKNSDMLIGPLSQAQLGLISTDKALFDYELNYSALGDLDVVWFRTSKLIPGLSGRCPSQADVQYQASKDKISATQAATIGVIKSIDDVGQTRAITDLPPIMYAAINNAGEVLVDQLKPARAFVWHDGVTTNLPETIDSFSGMNNSGQFVGYINLPPPNHSLHHAILWDAKHGVLDLGAIGGEWRVFARRADWSEARAVNNRGQVVGTSSIKLGDSATQSGHAFLWEKGAMIDLGAPEGTESSAEAINASGEVVGEILFGDSESRGFIWKRGTGMTTLGTLGGVRSAAHDINDAGDVVGDSQTVQGYFHPFLLHQGGNMADLCTLGGRDAVATAINNAGQVVGWSEINWGDKKERHAFLWNRGKMIDLSVLPGVKAAGWAELTVGWGINDQGQIVGYGVRDGRPQVFFLTLDPTSSQVR